MELLSVLSRPGFLLSLLFSRLLGLHIIALLMLLCACQTIDTSALDAKTKSDSKLQAADLYVVDCLLPGQVRRLGSMTYLSPRRPARTTAVDCRIRGGEYVAYDRADYRSALNVWLPMAREGDPEAQTYVGEIFEKGVGDTPDYTAAFEWYQKAANQGFVRGQINLGYLYEKGLGVEKDVAEALNWYRKASGLSEDSLLYASEANQALDDLREELTGKVSLAEQQSSFLQKQLRDLNQQRSRLLVKQQSLSQQLKQRSNTELQKQLDEASAELALAKREINVLDQLYTRADQEKEELKGELDALPKLAFRNASPLPLIEPVALGSDKGLSREINFGRYFALIIGNQDYFYLDDLQSPLKDAKRLQGILEDQYGFSTILLADASEKKILNALSDLYEQIGPEDNLLIYYAGHGNLSESSNSRRRRGYWLPVDAQEDRSTNWINNTVISDHLDRLKARSVLVVADSCYAGNMASEKSEFLLGSVNSSLTEASIQSGLSRRARLVISSGGVKPVLDGINGQHSMFAGSLIEILENNEGVLRDNMLFSRLAVNVRRRNQAQDVDNTPEMRPIRSAGHGGGDFYFVPRAARVGSLETKSIGLAQR